MNVIKSKGGYFYRLYKNGKKKRISKIEYNKIKLKSKKSKKSNLVGGSLKFMRGMKKKQEPIANLSRPPNNLSRPPNSQFYFNENPVGAARQRLAFAQVMNKGNTFSISHNIGEIIGNKITPLITPLNTLLLKARTRIDVIELKMSKTNGRLVSRNAVNNFTELLKLIKQCEKIIRENPQLNKSRYLIILGKYMELRDKNYPDIEIYMATNRHAYYTEEKSDADVDNTNPIELWDVSKITTMSHMFNGMTSFNKDIGGWDVSNVTDMEGMFNGATSFNKDIGGWDVSKVTDMEGMFNGATSFNKDIGGWVVSKVTDMEGMFKGASSFNKDIGDWNMSNVTMIYGMFQDATSFNQDISKWNGDKIVRTWKTYDNCQIADEFKFTVYSSY